MSNGARFFDDVSWEQMKPALPPIDVPGSTPFQRMDNLFRKVVTVSKEEIDRREEAWAKQNGKNGKKRKKTPKG